MSKHEEPAPFMTDRRDGRVPADCPEVAHRPRRSAPEGAGAPTLSSEFDTAMMSAHRKNIARYQRLLMSELTVDERRYVERRVAEEQAALRRIFREAAPSFPVRATRQ